MKRMIRPAVSVAGFALAAAAAQAHEGPRIWLGIEEARLVTYASDNDFDPTTFTPSLVFATEFQPLFGIWTTEFPGFEVRTDGGGVAPGTTIGFDLTGPALYYDAVSGHFVDAQTQFGTPGPVPQVALSLGSSLRITAGGAVSGFDFFTFFGVGDHSHLAFTLLGNGVSPSDGPAGVYAVQLQLHSSAAGESKVFWLLIGKAVATSDPLFLEAVAEAELVLQPAPCSGDADLDGDVDLDDLLLVLGGFGCSTECGGDLDQDGDVDLDDLLLVLGAFGAVCA